MKLSEFKRRARASRLERKAKLEAALQRAIRDLNLPDVPSPPPGPCPSITYIRSEVR